MASKEKKQKILLSADSTCDLDEELKERYHVHYFPFHIHLDGKDYLDNVDITPEDIYQKYFQEKKLPKTAAVNVQEYIQHFRPWTEAGYEVLHISLGHSLSSSFQNCVLAARELGHIHVVDSGNLSTGTGLSVVAAGKMIQEGLDAETIAKRLQERTHLCHASFVLDTLTFLHAGGRCSAVAALGANMLKLKPCIQVNNQDGSMSVGKKYRGSLESALVKYVREELGKYPRINQDLLFITHSGIPQHYIDLVKETVEGIIKFKEIHITKASCTISCHCGPNTLGILFETL